MNANGRPARLAGSYALLATLFCSGCLAARAQASDPFHPTDDACVRIVVENHGFYDVTVYVVREGVPFRLGTAPGLITTVFRADAGLVGRTGSYHLMADYIGIKQRFLSEPIPPILGATAIWRLEQSYWQSSVVIR